MRLGLVTNSLFGGSSPFPANRNDYTSYVLSPSTTPAAVRLRFGTVRGVSFSRDGKRSIGSLRVCRSAVVT